MNTKHRAYALTEMLVIIVVLTVLMGLSIRPMRTLISEIPRSARVCQTLNTTTKVLEQLKNDITQADHPPPGASSVRRRIHLALA